MNDDLTVEQREEARLLKSFASGGKRKPAVKYGSAAVEEETPAPAAAKEERQPGELPAWKKKQLAEEEETRKRLEREAEAKAKQLATCGQVSTESETPLSPKATEEDRQREKVLVDYMQGKAKDMDAVHKAAEAEKARLESIFKSQPKSNKKRFGDVSAEAKANMEAANKQRAEENSRLQKEEAEMAEKTKALQAERAASAVKTLRAAEKHYDGDSAKELYMNDLENAVVKEVESLRMDPKSYIAKLRARRMCYEGNVVTLDDPNGPTVRIKTNDGVRAVDEAIAALEAAKPCALMLEAGLVRAMFTAVRKGGRPNAVADVANYGTVSGSARQLVYRGPVLDATDVVVSLLIDDGEAKRSRRSALLDAKFQHFGIAACTDEKGTYNYCYLLLLSNFKEKE